MELRQPYEHELAAASRLCLRSKAHWGYNADFIAACEAELTIGGDHLARDAVVVAVDKGKIVGVAQLSLEDAECYLEKLFVDPDWMGMGVGRSLFEWSANTAKRLGASEIIVESDPNAASFYRQMGATEAGSAPSASIPGRKLPRFVFKLA
jgi:N-acetylglutamate synthase-like GNAT family acetyltransferase